MGKQRSGARPIHAQCAGAVARKARACDDVATQSAQLTNTETQTIAMCTVYYVLEMSFLSASHSNTSLHMMLSHDVFNQSSLKEASKLVNFINAQANTHVIPPKQISIESISNVISIVIVQQKVHHIEMAQHRNNVQHNHDWQRIQQLFRVFDARQCVVSKKEHIEIGDDSDEEQRVCENERKGRRLHQNGR